MGSRIGLLGGSLWGTALALSFATLLLLTALVQWAIGAFFGISTPYAVAELPIGALVLAYFAGGVSAGAALGVLWPRSGGAVPAMLAGVFAAMLFVTAVRVAIFGLTGWTAADLLAVYARAWGTGAIAALLVWKSRRDFPRKRRWR
ncbi:MAG TPA: hypothetical protein VGR27_14280 [Longimicrobiaceae bacterium]|nr:hypothetical protein [Longimicrobiaceae bacterium]